MDSVIDFSKEKQIKIDYVEIASELMRTPIFQKMIENKNLKICKTILIDEIYNNFIKCDFHIKELKEVFPYKKKEKKKKKKKGYI